METERPMSEEESLQLITSMINKAKCDYNETGISALMWGTIITFCSLVSFAGFFYNWQWVQYVWFLTIFAIIPQVIISSKENKKRKYSTYSDDAIGGIWFCFGISVFLLFFYTSQVPVEKPGALFLILYGIPTFATGFTKRFKPMVIGGIACWVFAVASIYISYPYSALLTAAGAQLAWFIPGLILRKRYIRLTMGNV